MPEPDSSPVTNPSENEPDPLLQAPLVPSYGVNPTFSHASTILEMKNSSNSKGRHVITNKPVKIGDVLFSEPPYASILLPEHYSSHCHHCVSLYLIFTKLKLVEF